MDNWFTIQASAETADIFLFDGIGGNGITAKAFADKFKDIPARAEITVRINSGGGSVFDGLAIHSLLSSRRGMVTTRVEGIAASIASVIALAGKRVTAAKSALMMIHDPSGVVWGRSTEMNRTAGVLDKVRDQLAAIYSEKTRKPVEKIKAAMTAETWFTATEAKDYGLVDALVETAAITNAVDLSRFKNAPVALFTSAAVTRGLIDAGNYVAAWKSAPHLQAEFPSAESYAAWKRGVAQGCIKPSAPVSSHTAETHTPATLAKRIHLPIADAKKRLEEGELVAVHEAGDRLTFNAADLDAFTESLPR